MNTLDFENRENRKLGLDSVSDEYIKHLSYLAEKSEYYPTYHVAPKHGLMNDPNGLVQLDGWYHLFYQWFPLGPVHGLKHWYHVKTKDFLHYIDMGVAMTPEIGIDEAGCYSGMIEACSNNVYYTGVDSELRQNVCKAMFVDEKIVDRKVIIELDPSLTTQEFRDPYVFDMGQRKGMIVGAKLLNEQGSFILYEEKDEEFHLVGPLQMEDAQLGYMLECPNLLSIDGKDIVVFSPQGIESPDKYTYRNVFSVAYGIGKLDMDNGSFACDGYEELDKGFDFYAPQIFKDEQGRNLMLAWLGNSKCVYPSDHEQWAHMMTLPREIKLVNDRIYQWPIEELSVLRGHETVVADSHKLSSQSFELDLNVEENFEIVLSNKNGDTLVFSGNGSEYILDRGGMTHLYNEQYGNVRYAKRKRSKDSLENIRIYVDRSSIEIFAAEGAVSFTSRFYLDGFNNLNLSGCNGTMYYMKDVVMMEVK